MDRIPLALASAMLAGILFKFGVEAFVSMQNQFTLVMTMFAVYLAAKRFIPRYAILAVLLVGLVLCGWLDLLDFSAFDFSIGSLQFVAPSFTPERTDRGRHSAVYRHHGVAKHSRYSGPARLGLSTADVADHKLDRPGVAAAGPVRRFRHQPRRHYRGNLLRPGSTRRRVETICRRAQNGIAYLIVGLFGAAIAGLFAAFPGEFVPRSPAWHYCRPSAAACTRRWRITTLSPHVGVRYRRRVLGPGRRGRDPVFSPVAFPARYRLRTRRSGHGRNRGGGSSPA